jgi:hypothetical protein
MVLVSDIDLDAWLAGRELQPCPCCRGKSAVSLPKGGFRLCRECGLLNVYGERVVDLSKSDRSAETPLLKRLRLIS